MRNVAARPDAHPDLRKLVPGKGFHFASGPYVEYEGTVPAEWKEKLLPLLNAECGALVRACAPTRVELLSAGDTHGLQRMGLALDDIAHLPAHKPVRIVVVGGSEGHGLQQKGQQKDNACPCGGTHVKSSDEIGEITVKAVNVKKGRTTLKYTIAV